MLHYICNHCKNSLSLQDLLKFCPFYDEYRVYMITTEMEREGKKVRWWDLRCAKCRSLYDSAPPNDPPGKSPDRTIQRFCFPSKTIFHMVSEDGVVYYKFLNSSEMWDVVIGFDRLVDLARQIQGNVAAYVKYGSFVENDSKDADFVYCPPELIPKYGLEGTNMWTIEPGGGEYSDVITKTQIKKSDYVATFAYANLLADYGEEFAREWLQLMEVNILPLNEMFKKNEEIWYNEFINTLIPRVWAKWQFARLQRRAWEEKGVVLNRKSTILKFAKDCDPELSDLLNSIWYSDITKEVLGRIGIEVGVDEEYGEVVFKYGDRVVSYPINIEIDLYSATEEEYEMIYESKMGEIEENPLDFEESNILYNGKRAKIKISYEAVEWDGYGL